MGTQRTLLTLNESCLPTWLRKVDIYKRFANAAAAFFTSKRTSKTRSKTTSKTLSKGPQKDLQNDLKTTSNDLLLAYALANVDPSAHAPLGTLSRGPLESFLSILGVPF